MTCQERRENAVGGQRRGQETIPLMHQGFQPASGMVRDLTPRGTQLFAIKTPRETNDPLCLVRVASRASTQKAECQQEGLKQGMKKRLWKEQKQGLLWEGAGRTGYRHALCCGLASSQHVHIFIFQLKFKSLISSIYDWSWNNKIGERATI